VSEENRQSGSKNEDATHEGLCVRHLSIEQPIEDGRGYKRKVKEWPQIRGVPHVLIGERFGILIEDTEDAESDHYRQGLPLTELAKGIDRLLPYERQLHDRTKRK
jgi:hypothetical protein